jgi:hypothetical protein
VRIEEIPPQQELPQGGERLNPRGELGPYQNQWQMRWRDENPRQAQLDMPGPLEMDAPWLRQVVPHSTPVLYSVIESSANVLVLVRRDRFRMFVLELSRYEFISVLIDGRNKLNVVGRLFANQNYLDQLCDVYDRVFPLQPPIQRHDLEIHFLRGQQVNLPEYPPGGPREYPENNPLQFFPYLPARARTQSQMASPGRSEPEPSPVRSEPDSIRGRGGTESNPERLSEEDRKGKRETSSNTFRGGPPPGEGSAGGMVYPIMIQDREPIRFPSTDIPDQFLNLNRRKGSTDEKFHYVITRNKFENKWNIRHLPWDIAWDCPIDFSRIDHYYIFKEVEVGSDFVLSSRTKIAQIVEENGEIIITFPKNVSEINEEIVLYHYFDVLRIADIIAKRQQIESANSRSNIDRNISRSDSDQQGSDFGSIKESWRRKGIVDSSNRGLQNLIQEKYEGIASFGSSTIQPFASNGNYFQTPFGILMGVALVIFVFWEIRREKIGQKVDTFKRSKESYQKPKAFRRSEESFQKLRANEPPLEELPFFKPKPSQFDLKKLVFYGFRLFLFCGLTWIGMLVIVRPKTFAVEPTPTQTLTDLTKHGKKTAKLFTSIQKIMREDSEEEKRTEKKKAQEEFKKEQRKMRNSSGFSGNMKFGLEMNQIETRAFNNNAEIVRLDRPSQQAFSSVYTDVSVEDGFRPRSEILWSVWKYNDPVRNGLNVFAGLGASWTWVESKDKSFDSIEKIDLEEKSTEEIRQLTFRMKESFSYREKRDWGLKLTLRGKFKPVTRRSLLQNPSSELGHPYLEGSIEIKPDISETKTNLEAGVGYDVFSSSSDQRDNRVQVIFWVSVRGEAMKKLGLALLRKQVP